MVLISSLAIFPVVEFSHRNQDPSSPMSASLIVCVYN